MASSINASSSGAGGLISSGDSSGALDIQTAGTTAIAISSAQVVTVQGITVGRGGGAIATNTAVGAGALPSNTTGLQNTASGYAAMFSNTTGNANTASGFQALTSNTTGSNNTAVGQNALVFNTTASDNTAVGYQAGYTNTTGSPISVFGFRAGYLSATATQLTAIGYASFYNSTGNFNTGVGHNTGLNVTSGTRNVAIGASALSTSGSVGSTGSSNTAVGVIALQSNTSGANNTAVGDAALASNTTGADNTSVGRNALLALTTGNNNQAFGNSAGSVLTTGSGNLLIGMASGSSLTTATANTFVGPNWNTNGAGSAITTGSGNTIIGAYTGNQGGLDIRTLVNRIVLSDGAGNPRGIFDGDGSFYIGLNPPPGYGGNAAFVVTYLGSTRPGVRFYDTLTGSSASTVQNFVRNGTSVGQIYTTDTATAYVTSSDYRLKENVQPMTGALAKVTQLKPCTYTWKSSDADGQGFIAHELQEVFPDAVYGEKDGVDKDGNPDYQGIDTSFLVATLTAAIQELNAKVTELEAQLGAK